nr:MAG TPA: hypothetical protein [Bacteriophage sp.]
MLFLPNISDYLLFKNTDVNITAIYTQHTRLYSLTG